MIKDMNRNQPFNSDTLEMKEVTAVSLVRLHSLQNLGQLSSIPLELPEKTGQCSDGNPAALCLRPKEWLLISETIDPSELLQKVLNDIDMKLTSAYDQSDGLAVLRLSGRGAPWLLSKLSGLDHLAGMALGTHGARTKMGHVAAVVYYHQAEGGSFVFDLIFDRSMTNYLWDLLSESAPHADDLVHAFGNAA
jgi:heterotetrameric sarcosine oxidase gamma subunit